MGKKLKQGGNGTVAKTAASESGASAEKHSKPSSGHTKPRPVPAGLEDDVRLRSGQVMTLFGISHSTLYQRMRDGKIPKPDGHDGRPYWRQRTFRSSHQG